MGNSAASVEPAAGFDDLAVGIVGTGMMATAHATAWSSLGMKVYIGSRDAARGQALARKIGNGCKGGTHAEMLAADCSLGCAAGCKAGCAAASQSHTGLAADAKGHPLNGPPLEPDPVPWGPSLDVRFLYPRLQRLAF